MPLPVVIAHALVGKQDLPIPAWLFAWAACLVLIASFAALALLWREPRLEDDRWRPVAGGLSAFATSRVTHFVTGLVAVLLLGAAVWTGLAGTESPDRNFSITFVFVTVWLGFVALSVVLGDVFRAFNPWGAIGRLFEAIIGAGRTPPLAHPERLGRWPAAIGLLAFLWLELVYGEAGFGSVGLEPRIVAIAILLYSVYTVAAMTLYGVDTWLKRGETFSVYFSMFASLAPFEVRDGRLGRRRLLAGAKNWVNDVAGSAAMVLIAIGGTAYDGAREGALEGSFKWFFDRFVDIGFSPVLSQRLAGTVLMLLMIGFVALVYWAGVAGMRTVGGEVAGRPLREVGRMFVHSFIPIALAYLVAHYFTLLLYQMQAQFTYLINDPLGEGANLLGITETGIDYSIISANAVWYVQVAALVIGHVTALAMAHDRAVAVFGNSRIAARSQYWMLALMVLFTSLGLFLLSQANQ